jgi:hypothetical protein
MPDVLAPRQCGTIVAGDKRRQRDRIRNFVGVGAPIGTTGLVKYPLQEFSLAVSAAQAIVPYLSLSAFIRG